MRKKDSHPKKIHHPSKRITRGEEKIEQNRQMLRLSIPKITTTEDLMKIAGPRGYKPAKKKPLQPLQPLPLPPHGKMNLDGGLVRIPNPRYEIVRQYCREQGYLLGGFMARAALMLIEQEKVRTEKETEKETEIQIGRKRKIRTK